MAYDELRKYIIKQAAGEIGYDATRQRFHLSLRTITASLRNDICAEAERWGMPQGQVDSFINTTVTNIALAYKAAEQPEQMVNLRQDLSTGNELRLSAHEDGTGRARLNLLFLGRTTADAARFLVLDATRTTLRRGDMVEPFDNELWATGFPLRLRIVRDGRPWPGDGRVYHTYRLDGISLCLPSLVHDVIDSQREFTFREHQAAEQNRVLGDSTLSLGANPMSLLLHEFSTLMPAYASFDDDGEGTFSPNEAIDHAPSPMRNLLFSVSNDTLQRQTLRLRTTQPGRLFLQKEDRALSFREAAQTEQRVAERQLPHAAHGPAARKKSAAARPVMAKATPSMEDIADDIRQKFLDDADNAGQYIPNWREQCRQRGISIVALETLLNFYAQPAPTPTQPATDGLAAPEVVLADGDTRQQLLHLQQENARLRQQIEELRSQLHERSAGSRHKWWPL